MRFQEARRRHHAVGSAAKLDATEAAALWAAVNDDGEPTAGSYAEAVRDTAPTEYASLLAGSPVACAYAFSMHWTAASQGTARLTGVALRDHARAAWEKFHERATATVALASGFGWSLEEAWTTLEDVAVGNGNTADVERVARLAGRMHAALSGARAGRVHGIPEEVHSVELGNNIPRLLPTEHAQLMDPDLELPVLVRIIEGRALQYAVRGSSHVSKGPLVMALDESSSMRGYRNEWARAAAIALMRIAFEEKRDVVVIHFSTSVVVRQIKPGDAGAVVEMIRHFMGGGTAIGLALANAAEQVRELTKKGQSGADVVLVTDGEDGRHDSQNAALVTGPRRPPWTVAIECWSTRAPRSVTARRPTSSSARHR
jgi:Mg-chelatase subunit ChlD